MDRGYPAAINALNSLQSNFSVVNAIRKSGRSMNQNAIPEMVEWCRRIGYEPSDFDRIRPIHIAGTKGKGSTSAFISSILCEYASRVESTTSLLPRKIGLYTSPHLRFVRERIRINGEPISEEMFARYFFEVWDRLETSAQSRGVPANEAKPVYFRFLTLMAFHTYLCEGVDSAVIECGVGGEYDSTNIINKPTVCAVTSLGIDHVAMLGSTIEEIAWHKAGIFKACGVAKTAYTVDQPKEALEVLQHRADEQSLKLEVIQRHPQLLDGKLSLGLSADFQKTNASLAIAVTSAHLQALGVSDIPDPLSSRDLPAEFKRGLEAVKWPGRCDARKEGNICWYLDGGHTLESIRLSADWFSSCVSTQGEAKHLRILLFNQQTRDASTLAKTLHEALSSTIYSTEEQPLFNHAVFSTNITHGATSGSASAHYSPDLVNMNASSTSVADLVVQNELAATWTRLDPRAKVSVSKTLEDALNLVRSLAAQDENMQIDVLVTGSLHLVGGVLQLIESR